MQTKRGETPFYIFLELFLSQVVLCLLYNLKYIQGLKG